MLFESWSQYILCIPRPTQSPLHRHSTSCPNSYISSYTNRFHTLSSLIRKLHDEYIFEKHIPSEWEKQLLNLNGRIKLLRYSIFCASFGFLFNMLTVLGLYLNRIFEARIIFGSCCLAMIISIIFFIIEIQISTKALRLHLSDVKINLS
jgi:uncharacterized membrane protein